MSARLRINHFSSPEFLVRPLPVGMEIVRTSNGSTRVVTHAVADAFVLDMLTGRDDQTTHMED